MSEFVIQLKKQRATIDVDTDDIFMDNGHCIQLLTKGGTNWNGNSIPIKCTNRMIEAIEKNCERVIQQVKDYNYGLSIVHFKLKLKEIK